LVLDRGQINLDLERINIVIGRNGVGKTTLLESIHSLFSSPHHGKYSFNISGENEDVGPSGADVQKGRFDHSQTFFKLGGFDPQVHDSNPVFDRTIREMLGEPSGSFDNSFDLSSYLKHVMEHGLARFESRTPDPDNPFHHEPVGLLQYLSELNAPSTRDTWLVLHTWLFADCVLHVNQAPSQSFPPPVPPQPSQSVLYARVPRERVSEFCESVGLDLAVVLQLLKHGASRKNIYEVTYGMYAKERDGDAPISRSNDKGWQIALADAQDSIEAELSRLLEPTENLFREVGNFFVYDGALMVPLCHDLDASVNMQSVFVRDPLVQDPPNLETIVIQLASSLSRCIGDGIVHPAVDWLYAMGEEWQQVANSRRDIPGGPYYRIHPAVKVACRYVQRYLNKNLPAFISDEFEFLVEPLDLSSWIESESKRVRLSAIRKSDLETDISTQISNYFGLSHTGIEQLGAGVRRWVDVVLKVLEAETYAVSMEDLGFEEAFYKAYGLEGWLEDSSQFEELFDETFYDDGDLYLKQWGYLCEHPTAHELVELCPTEQSHIILIDEPEANLHPDAVESIIRWMIDMAAKGNMFIVATHNLRVFDLQTVSVRRFTMRSNDDLVELDHDVSYLDSWAVEMGFTPGEMFLATKRWLIVEGEVDREVLRAWYEPLFRERGVRVIPAHGVGNVDQLMQVDFLGGIGARVSVLLDSDAPDSSPVKTDTLRGRIERGLLQQSLLGQQTLIEGKLSASEVIFGVEKHEQVDVLLFLDEECVNVVVDNLGRRREGSRRMDSWSRAWDEFVAEASGVENTKRATLTVKNFKAFLEREFGIRLDKDMARKVAVLQRQRGKIPESLTATVMRITSPFYGEPLVPKESKR